MDLKVLAIKVSGLIITFMLFLIIRLLLAKNKSFEDFFIGDNGTYSLSRAQMIAWVYIIISYQLSVIVTISIMHGLQNTYHFNLIFSEEILWLLGMSYTSYITVKGITNDKITKTRKAPLKLKKLSDLITGDNGLDFSKFQFIIWTLVAIYIYILSCNQYLNDLIITKDTNRLKELLSIDYPQIPNISWSFIVLMGLSQGTYIGKKLIPTFKAEEYKEERMFRLDVGLTTIEQQLEEKKTILKNLKPITEIGLKQRDEMKKIVDELQEKRDRLSFEFKRLKI